MSEDGMRMPHDALIRRYLLGEATDEEAHALERAYFAEESSLDTVSSVEWELIDDYLSDRLDPAARGRFEKHYQRTAPHRTRVAIARALRSRALPKRTRMVPFLLPLAAAAILVMAVVGIVWALRVPPQTSVVALAVPLVQVRAEGDAPTAVLEDGTDVLELRFPAGTVPVSQAVALRTVEGREVWRGTTEGTAPAARIPAEDLAAGDYVVELQGGPRAYVRVLRR